MAKRRPPQSVPGRRSLPSLANRPPPAAIRNLLLAALPDVDRDRVATTLDVIPLILKDFLYKPADRIRYVYFPGGGFCSIVTVLQNGSMVEVATIGREGMVGMTAGPDGNLEPSAAMVQGETDTCYRMTMAAFWVEMDRRGAFFDLLSRYAQAMLGVIMQATACNAVHGVEQRLARWLLMAHDRMGNDEFPLTQEFAAMMLGATRPTVSVVASLLQKAGLITYHRGHVTIVDRAKLEAASCECYGVATRLMHAVTST